MTRNLVSAVIVICGLSASVWAQSTLPIAVDQRVRIWTAAAEAVTGKVVGVTRDTLQIAVDGRDQTTVAVATVRRVEVSRGRESKAKKYAIRGAIISGLLGAISLGLQHDTVGEQGSSVGKAAALGAFSGGLFGGVIGGAIGAVKSADRWEQVWP